MVFIPTLLQLTATRRQQHGKIPDNLAPTPKPCASAESYKRNGPSRSCAHWVSTLTTLLNMSSFWYHASAAGHTAFAYDQAAEAESRASLSHQDSAILEIVLWRRSCSSTLDKVFVGSSRDFFNRTAQTAGHALLFSLDLRHDKDFQIFYFSCTT